MSKYKFTYINLITMLVTIGSIVLYNTIYGILSVRGNFDIGVDMRTIVSMSLPLLVQLMLLSGMYIYIRKKYMQELELSYSKIILYVGLSLLIFGSVRIIGIPFGGIKSLLLGMNIESQYLTGNDLLRKYLLSYLYVIPFTYGAIVVIRRRGLWYIEGMKEEEQHFVYTVIHGMLVMYTFSTLQEVGAMMISDDIMMTQYLWVELLNTMSITLVLAAIMWVVLNGIRVSYSKKSKSTIRFGDIKCYIGIMLFSGFCYSIFAVPVTITEIILVQKGEVALALSDLIYPTLVYVGLPLLAVILGITWMFEPRD